MREYGGDLKRTNNAALGDLRWLFFRNIVAIEINLT
jgi:hypothetical protein